VKSGRLTAAAEILVLLLTAFFLYQGLRGDHGEESEIRRHIIENGSSETGALNLVTSIYLGYRAFDTLGETMVLLLAVSGGLFLLKPGSSGNGHDERGEDGYGQD